jgi:hypothetical protein
MSTQVAVKNELEIPVDETPAPVDETPAPVDETTVPDATQVDGASETPAAKPMRILKEGDAADDGETLYTVTDGKVVGPDEQELEDGSLKTEILNLVAGQEGGRRHSRRNRRQSKKRQQKRQSKKQNGGKKRNSKRNSKRNQKK